MAAARGCIALITGDRRAAEYFDFSLRGLAGSFVAFFVATAFSAYLPLLSGGSDKDGWIGRLLLIEYVVLAGQIGFSALMLRQIKRLDGLVPYLVADNWTAFFLTAILSLLVAFGITGDILLVALVVVVLLMTINIARLIVTLTPGQIVAFLVAQAVGAFVVLMLVALVVPLPPDLIAALPNSQPS